jgi:hypothetical protein
VAKFERSDLIGPRAVFLKALHEVKQSIPDILRILINSIILYSFPRKSSTILTKYWRTRHFENHGLNLSVTCTAIPVQFNG